MRFDFDWLLAFGAVICLFAAVDVYAKLRYRTRARRRMRGRAYDPYNDVAKRLLDD